jgi:hypothetical protein
MLSDNPAAGRWFSDLVVDGVPYEVQRVGGFLPAAVPRNPTLENSTHKLLTEAACDLARLDGATANLPSCTPFVVSALLVECQSSLGALGHYVTLDELLKAKVLEEPVPVDMPPEVIGLIDVDSKAVDRVQAGSPIGRTLLNLVSSSTTRRDNAGGSTGFAWRESHQWVGGREPGDALLLAPPPGVESRRALADCAEWIDERCDLPVVVKVALVSRYLSVLRPVGNTDHFVSLYGALEFMRAGLLNNRVLPLSAWIEHDRMRFGAQLQKSIVDKSLDAWCKFFAEGVRDACVSQCARITALMKMQKKHVAQTTSRRTDSKVRAAASLIGAPVFDTAHLAEVSHTSTRHGYNLISPIVGAGVVRKHSHGRRNRVIYEVPEVLQILREGYPFPPDTDSEVFDK